MVNNRTPNTAHRTTVFMVWVMFVDHAFLGLLFFKFRASLLDFKRLKEISGGEEYRKKNNSVPLVWTVRIIKRLTCCCATHSLFFDLGRTGARLNIFSISLFFMMFSSKLIKHLSLFWHRIGYNHDHQVYFDG